MDTLQRRSSSSPRSSSSSFSLEPCKSVKEEARSLKAAVKKLDDGAGKEAGASGDGETEMRMRRQLFRDHIQHRGLTTRPKTAQQEAKDKAVKRHGVDSLARSQLTPSSCSLSHRRSRPGGRSKAWSAAP